MAWNSPYRPWIAAILSGVLLALCFPNWDRSQLIWIWQAPVLLVLWFYDRPAQSLIRWRLVPRLPARLRGPRWGLLFTLPARGIDWVLDGGENQGRGAWGFKVGYLTGFAFFGINLHWLRHVAWPGWILLAAYLAVYFGLWGAFAATVGRIDRKKLEVTPPEPPPSKTGWGSALTGPDIWRPSFHTIRVAGLNAGCWVALEWIRGWMFTGFGWNGLGVALHGSPHLIQIVDVVGVAGLAFLPVYVTCATVATVVRLSLEIGRGALRPRLDFVSAMCLIVLALMYGIQARHRHTVEAPVELNALLVQGNVPMSIRNDLSRSPDILPLYEELTASALTGKVDLVVWPETPLPYASHDERAVGYVNHILSMGDFHFLTGMEQVDFLQDGTYEVFNAMYLMKGSFDERQAYQKIHRVPFGEFIPFRESFPLFRWVLGRLIPGDYQPGRSTQRLTLAGTGVELIPSICFEDTIGGLTRRFVTDEAKGPQLIVNLTNDGWFEKSEANAQHLANAKFRCVELKRPMIRCANTGLTCAIDEFGALATAQGTGRPQVLTDQAGSPFLAGALFVGLSLDSSPVTTFYARHGDWFGQAMAGLLALVCLWRLVRTRAARRPAKPREWGG
ncbi:MAG: apolipoprotein N-acyltransferase [Verrucomicrobia bacterium]|nr:apolipoprotein N-acyltransferase [Verrucomicrobiota bacterium]